MANVKTSVLGFPRIGNQRELKKACEAYWAGKLKEELLLEQGSIIRRQNWKRMRQNGIDLIPSNDFSFYDHVLDLAVALGVVPRRYDAFDGEPLKRYFAMARGYQAEGKDVIAQEMTKWFNTNYHYIVPEFSADQQFRLSGSKAADEYREALAEGIATKPVVVGPVTFLLLGKEKEAGFRSIELLSRLLPAYVALLKQLADAGAEWIQIDEPMLCCDLDESQRAAYRLAFDTIAREVNAKIILTTYFGTLGDNAELAASLPTEALHVDLVADATQIDTLLPLVKGTEKTLSLGVVDGRNIWKNDIEKTLQTVRKAIAALGEDRVIVATSTSLLHVPCDLANETREDVLPQGVKRWLAFAWQKVEELHLIAELLKDAPQQWALDAAEVNREDVAARTSSPLIHNASVKARAATVIESETHRHSPYAVRAAKQRAALGLPAFPTTTIGSFPQTREVRSWRAAHKKGELSDEKYETLLKEETRRCVEWQQEIGLDVLVHGEFERNDMVEYFGEKLSGFAFTQNGWVQSYGSRCVKPPVIYGDVWRPQPMTVAWSTYAQQLTDRPVKGMLTGPVTILEWSFVRDDQPRQDTCRQIALAIRDEVTDLERAGLKVIQIDEPAIREGMPLRRSQWQEYLHWAVESFRISASGVADETQIHTHMCYAEFNDIIGAIAEMDADVITIECSRSQMELLDVFRDFRYPNEIGPGVYDIHSARVPEVKEMVGLLRKAAALISPRLLWVNPDCGLKTRDWPETKESLTRMVEAARILREEFKGTLA